MKYLEHNIQVFSSHIPCFMNWFWEAVSNVLIKHLEFQTDQNLHETGLVSRFATQGLGILSETTTTGNC